MADPLAIYDHVWGDLGDDPDRHTSIARCMEQIRTAPTLDAAVEAVRWWGVEDERAFRRDVRRARRLMGVATS